MIEITGKHNSAICYTDTLETSAYAQISAICDESAFSDCKIRIMPDVHAGMGCTIGTTMTITDKVVPGMVGVDIGCGMESVRIAEKDVDFEKLDALIRFEIPCGFNVRNTPHLFSDEINLDDLRCADQVNAQRALLSIGTLGGGNHFIEMDKDEKGDIYLVIHSGSRHLGHEAASYYQEQGYRTLSRKSSEQMKETIAKLKAQGRFSEIQDTILKIKNSHPVNLSIHPELAYVEGALFEDYIHDMKIIQRFASLNRKAMTDIIISGMGFTEIERFTTVHNYIDTEQMILRKGAVSAKCGEKLLIPINMRDGSLICIGKGNPDWNCSAPHGAGRLISRHTAFSSLSMETYKKQMEGIYTTCVLYETLDESPMAYKSINDIISQIGPTADIIHHIKPIYNFKASS